MDQARMQRRNRRKKAALAVALVALLALAGTFAWANYTQTALNEAKSSAQPGGRLHDDFTFKTAATANKDVYVENFNDPDSDDGVPVYARVRFLEYMEKGPGAGSTTPGTNNASSVADTGVQAGTRPQLTAKETWTLHHFEPTASDEDYKFRNYWDWDYAGSKFYMPTYNKNKDSLEADINGSMRDQRYDSTLTTWVDEPYYNYRAYASAGIPDDKVDASDNLRDARYDADTDLFDEGTSSVVNVNHTVQRERHESKETLGSEVISIDKWKSTDTANGGKEGKPGNFWVYDTDGWAYWANPINPGEATGLLLDNIAPKAAFGEDWYYGIDAQAQFVSYGEWGGDPTNGYTFTTTSVTNGTAIKTENSKPDNDMSADAFALLEAAKKNDTSANKTTYRLKLELGSGESTTVEQGGNVTVTPTLTKVEAGVESAAGVTPTYTWTISPADQADKAAVSGSDAQKVTVKSSATPGGKIRVEAKATFTPAGGTEQTVTSFVELTVEESTVPPAAAPFEGKEPSPASPVTVKLDTNNDTIPETDFLFLDKLSSTDMKFASDSPVKEAGNYGLVMLKEPTTTSKFNSADNNPRWSGSVAQSWCNNTYYAGLGASLKALIPKVTLTTSTNGSQTSTATTDDFAFYLSEADMFGTCAGSNVTNDALYTGSKHKLINDNANRTITYGDKRYWLRSATSSDTAAYVDDAGAFNSNGYREASTMPARPAFWVYLGA